MLARIFSHQAKAQIQKRAKELRFHGTEAEQLLWEHLRNRKLNGYKFRRQHPIDRFIVDFFCYQGGLIIELDGKIHEKPDQSEYDEGRTYELYELGYTVVRFKNQEVFNDIDKVLEKIEQYLS